MISLTTSELRFACTTLHAGDRILLSGSIYAARDAAHKRIARCLDCSLPLPFPLRDAVLYYTGPTPAPEGLPIGSCGPTTSARMDPYTPRLYDLGVVCTIGKGPRSREVVEAIVRNAGVYLCAAGGLGALLGSFVVSSSVCAYPELGCEAVRLLQIRDFPLYVGVDCSGSTIFDGR